MYDEPLAVPETARSHYAGCASCQERFSEIAGDARRLAGALAVPAATVDAAAAYRGLKPQLQPRPRFVLRLPRFSGASLRRGALVTGLAAVLVLGVVVSPLAQTIKDVFAPTQVQTVTLSQGSFAGFPDLSHWGTVSVTQQPELKQADTAADAAGSILPLIKPGNLPAGLPAPQYATLSHGSGSFTFSKAKADAYAASQGAKAPKLPSNLDGSRLDVSIGPAEAAIYGGDLSAAAQQGAKDETGSAGHDRDLLPALAIGIAKAPHVTSTGASVKDIENAVASQPGVSPELKSAILSIGDASKTLPIPVVQGMTVSDNPTLKDGTKAAFVGDNSGTLGGVIFIRSGNVYVVAGAYNEKTLVDIANTL
jgi:hypothetical protein